MNYQLQFRDPTPLVTEVSPCFSPPHFPPAEDFVVSLTKEGHPLSRYKDNNWDFRAFKSHSYNFSNWKISEQNLCLVKQAFFFVLYHPVLFPGKIASCHSYYITLVKIGKVCSENKILISELSSYPAVQLLVAEELKCSQYKMRIINLHKLFLYSQDIGFVIANKKTLGYLFTFCEERDIIQHPYIPPRIWTYLVKRLDAFLEDFLVNKVHIEKAYSFVASLYAEYSVESQNRKSAMKKMHNELAKRVTGSSYSFFDDYLRENQLYEFFDRWLPAGNYNHCNYSLTSLGRMLSLAQDVSIFYILAFSLQRKSEAGTLRSDCLIAEKDEKLGFIYLICGETTKTSTDSDARWVVPENVKKAIEAASFASHLRMQQRPGNINEDVVNNPYLLTPAWEPWFESIKTDTDHREVPDFSTLIRRQTKIFDKNELIVNEEDWAIALSITPNLSLNSRFGLNLPWHFSAHQLRRTANVNMFASSMVSDNSLQWAMKHLSRTLIFYYGRNYTNLRINSQAEVIVINEFYDSIYRKLKNIILNDTTYFKANDKTNYPDDIVQLISNKDEKKLKELIKNGTVSCRPTIVGYCLKNGACEYGGIESVTQCCGEINSTSCSYAVFSIKNMNVVERVIDAYKKNLSLYLKTDVKYNSLVREINALEIYLNEIKKRKQC